MQPSNLDCLPYSNSPLYFPAYLKQYGKEVKDYRDVNFTANLTSYQPYVNIGEDSTDTPEGDRVYFGFKGKNCWLWVSEWDLLKGVLHKVDQMTIRYKFGVGVGPAIPLWDTCLTAEEVNKQGEVEIEHDLLSGFFRVQAVLI